MACTSCHLHKSSFCKFLKGGEKGSEGKAAVAAGDCKALLNYQGMPLFIKLLFLLTFLSDKQFSKPKLVRVNMFSTNAYWLH